MLLLRFCSFKVGIFDLVKDLLSLVKVERSPVLKLFGLSVWKMIWLVIASGFAVYNVLFLYKLSEKLAYYLLFSLLHLPLCVLKMDHSRVARWRALPSCLWWELKFPPRWCQGQSGRWSHTLTCFHPMLSLSTCLSWSKYSTMCLLLLFPLRNWLRIRSWSRPARLLWCHLNVRTPEAYQ